jgi:ketosteroid isomerase-like protein
MTQSPLPPAEPPGRPRPWWIAGAVAGILLVATAGIVFAVAATREDSDEAGIRRLVADFALAVDRGDQQRLVRLLCAEEATEVKESDGYNPGRDGEYDRSVTEAPATTSDIKVTGDTAQARISRPGQDPTTLYFRKEDGSWTVCAQAGDTSEPGTSPS